MEGTPAAAAAVAAAAVPSWMVGSPNPAPPKKRKFVINLAGDEAVQRRQQVAVVDVVRPDVPVQSSDQLPDGILRETQGCQVNGRWVTASKKMSTQIKVYHAQFGKTVRMAKGAGRHTVWRCSDYTDKKILAEQCGVDFDPSMACAVVCTVGSNKYVTVT